MEAQAGTESPAVCPRCGSSFGCGARAGRCWCQELPALPDPNPAGGCYCPACLKLLATPAPAGAAKR